MFKQINTLLAAAGSEKSIVKHINSEKELFDIIRVNYFEAFNKSKENNTIFRGAKNYTEDCIAVEITPGKRLSQNTPNIYTKLLSDVFPSWSKFPKRNRSIIASFNLETASEYGLGHIVLPKNGAKIAICPDTDIWYSFKENGPFEELPQFNYEFVRTAAYVLKKPLTYIKEAFVQDSNDDAINILNELDIKFLEMCKNKQILNYLMKDYYEKWLINPSLLYSEYLENIIFNSSKFKIQNISNLKSNGISEVWFESSSIFIPVCSEFLLESLNISIEQ